MSIVTIKDVAQAAGVGISTVSRVVHHHPSVNPKLKQRVEEAIRQLGYEPNLAAQTMRTRSSFTIGCASRNISIPEFATFVRAAEALIRKAGYTLMLTNIDEEIEKEVELLRHFSRRRVDGLLLTKSTDNDRVLNAELEKVDFPVVLIDRDVSPIANTVILDHGKGIRAAVDYLVSLGHKRIALLTGKPTVRPGRERLEAFRAAMLRHGITPDPQLVSTRSFYAEESFHYVSLMLDATPPPTALITGGMALLSGALRAIKLRNMEIGRDISLIAGCDSDLAELSTPPITAIRWDIAAWGRTSAQLLLDQIASPNSPKGHQVILPTELVIRSSCRAL